MTETTIKLRDDKLELICECGLTHNITRDKDGKPDVETLYKRKGKKADEPNDPGKEDPVDPKVDEPKLRDPAPTSGDDPKPDEQAEEGSILDQFLKEQG